jgi:hypothetical protein
MRPRDANDHSVTAWNPLDVMNVPNPDDQEVLQFAAPTTLAGAADDENAAQPLKRHEASSWAPHSMENVR